LARGRRKRYVGTVERLFTCPSSAAYIYSDSALWMSGGNR
jgi:hypothetical protein